MTISRLPKHLQNVFKTLQDVFKTTSGSFGTREIVPLRRQEIAALKIYLEDASRRLGGQKLFTGVDTEFYWVLNMPLSW